MKNIVGYSCQMKKIHQYKKRGGDIVKGDS